MLIKTKGKIYKTAVRPAKTYGLESWTTLRKLETKLYTTEIEIAKSTVRRSFKISKKKKLRGNLLRWCKLLREDSAKHPYKTPG